jgi:L-rhamnose mutarotase
MGELKEINSKEIEGPIFLEGNDILFNYAEHKEKNTVINRILKEHTMSPWMHLFGRLEPEEHGVSKKVVLGNLVNVKHFTNLINPRTALFHIKKLIKFPSWRQHLITSLKLHMKLVGPTLIKSNGELLDTLYGDGTLVWGYIPDVNHKGEWKYITTFNQSLRGWEDDEIEMKVKAWLEKVISAHNFPIKGYVETEGRDWMWCFTIDNGEIEVEKEPLSE